MTAFFNTGASSASRAALDAIKALPNSGHLIITTTAAASADPDGTIPSGAAVLADFTFSASAFGADSTAGAFSTKTETATASFAASTVTALQTGTAASFYITNAGKTVAYATGSVGTSGADINFNSVAISSGANVTLSSFTLTQPQ
jgi:hypothetical protein